MATKTRGTIDDAPQIPDLADERDEVLIKAAKRYRQIKEELREAASELQDAEERVLKLMHEKGISKYRYKDLEIVIDQKEKAKVKIEPPKESDNGDGE